MHQQTHEDNRTIALKMDILEKYDATITFTTITTAITTSVLS